MSEYKEQSETTSPIEEEEETRGETQESCEGIDDPVRRTLCKVCHKPVLGALPFCNEHEPPVP